MRKLLLVAAALLLSCGGGNDRSGPEPALPGGPLPVPSGVPTATPPGDPDTGDADFTIAASPKSVVAMQGSAATISLTVVRAGTPGEAIEVGVEGLPSGVTASSLSIPAGSPGGSITVHAAATAAQPKAIPIRFRGRDSSGTASAFASLAVRGPPASLDRSFQAHPSLPDIYDAEALSDGSILFTGPDEDYTTALCRVNPDGSADLSFGDTGGCAHLSIHLDTAYADFTTSLRLVGDRIYVAGNYIGGEGHSGGFLARFTLEGAPDASFAGSGWIDLDAFSPVRIRRIGEGLVLAGYPGLLRLDGEGRRVATFGSNGMAVIGPSGAGDVVVASDGRLIAKAASRVYAVTSDGRPDTSFGSGGVLDLPIYANVLSPDAKGGFLVAGDGMEVVRFSSAGGITAIYPPLDPGSLEDGSPLHAIAHDVWVTEDGTIVMAGGDVTDDPYAGVGRRFADGAPDPTFGTGGVQREPGTAGSKILVLPDGRYVMAGTADTYYGVLVRIWN